MKMLWTIIICFFIFSCKNSSFKISNYNEKTETIKSLLNSTVIYDTLPDNINTYKAIKGDKTVFVFERTGTTVTGIKDWESKYIEELIFEVESIESDFEYSGDKLLKIKCKYFWVCYAETIKKEIRNVQNGCIKGTIVGDSLQIDINVKIDFEFDNSILKSDDKNCIVFKGYIPLS
ncbi:MAG: hypothetical protein PHH30_03710 [Bacteroidales bacterium]|nr:hypothetical protein [Bacteroidales bacterium]